jgi:hypothetical protein
VLELADPSTLHRLAPTPDDLFITSIASDLAWTARDLLRSRGLPDDVSVSAHSVRLDDPPNLADISMTVTVPETAEALSDAFEHALAERVAARSLDEAPRLLLRCAGWSVVQAGSRAQTGVLACSKRAGVDCASRSCR